MLLLDSNIVIYFIQGRKDIREWVEKQLVRGEIFAISSLTVVEILSYPAMQPEERHQIEQWLATMLVVDVGLPVAMESAKVRAAYSLKTVDSVIAGTAVHFSIPLVTRDKAFQKVRSCTVIVP
jgi:predicted nucleic acid-binding protein